MIESQTESGINHYGFVADDVNEVVTELSAKDADIVREIRDADSRLTTLFVWDWRLKLVHGGANLDIVDSGA